VVRFDIHGNIGGICRRSRPTVHVRIIWAMQETMQLWWENQVVRVFMMHTWFHRLETKNCLLLAMVEICNRYYTFDSLANFHKPCLLIFNGSVGGSMAQKNG